MGGMEPGNSLDEIVTLLAMTGVLVAIPVTFVVMVLVRKNNPHGRRIPIWKRLKTWAALIWDMSLLL